MMIGADQFVILEHRHAEQCCDAGELDCGNHAAEHACGTPRSTNRSATWTTCLVRATRSNDCLGARPEHGLTLSAPRHRRRGTVQRHRRETRLPRRRAHCAEVRAADPHRVLQHGLEHRLQIARRDCEMTCSTSEVAVCCSSASLRSSVRWRSSLSSRVFSIAMTACAAKFCTSSICLSVNGRTSCR